MKKIIASIALLVTLFVSGCSQPCNCRKCDDGCSCAKDGKCVCYQGGECRCVCCSCK